MQDRKLTLYSATTNRGSTPASAVSRPPSRDAASRSAHRQMRFRGGSPPTRYTGWKLWWMLIEAPGVASSFGAAAQGSKARMSMAYKELPEEHPALARDAAAEERVYCGGEEVLEEDGAERAPSTGLGQGRREVGGEDEEEGERDERKGEDTSRRQDGSCWSSGSTSAAVLQTSCTNISAAPRSDPADQPNAVSRIRDTGKDARTPSPALRAETPSMSACEPQNVACKE
ncbi:hypothetical protein K438DRAFT_1938346 [Mycena galopus ATCC 62051]|nr:hypothetical protein K438DRAFT_1938346 [Mycena galopus ATCC 62051]